MDFRRPTRDASRSHVGERAHDVLVRAGSCRLLNYAKSHKMERDKPSRRFLLLLVLFFQKEKYKNFHKHNLSKSQKEKITIPAFHNALR